MIAKISKQGFTLLELLIVIAIIAVLSTVVVLLLNPGEYLKQTRDSQRLNDLDSLRNALNLFLYNATSTNPLGTCPSGGRCTFNPGAGNGPFVNATCSSPIATSTAVNGTGWVDVNFSGLSVGSPLARLPMDPSNSATLFYAYACDNAGLKFKLAGKLESDKFKSQMLNSNDGGTKDTFYEVGNNMGL